MKTIDKVTWPLWECISTESLVVLIQYQHHLYKTKLDLITDHFREVEDVEEIGRLMKIPTKWRKPPE